MTALKYPFLLLDTIGVDDQVQARAEINSAVVEEYAEAMNAGTKFPPLIVFKNDGSQCVLADGFHRYYAAVAAGINAFECDVHSGGKRDAILYAVGANTAHGLRRTNTDKRCAVMALLNDAEWAKWSDNEVARRCGVSQPFVSEMRGGLSNNSYKIEPRQVQRGDSTFTMQMENIGRARGSEEDGDFVREQILATNRAGFVIPVPETRPASYHVSDDSYEWYTPMEYIEAARKVLGGIDLDPASSDEANKIVSAKQYYTKSNDGLAQVWSGRVWLNPPYNMPLIEQFIDRAIEAYKSGGVMAAIVLTNNSTDTAWFHKLLAYPVCLTRGRIQFENSDKRLATRQGQTLFYLGKERDLFARVFNEFGAVRIRYDNK